MRMTNRQRGVTHVGAAPTLEMIDVSVLYGPGSQSSVRLRAGRRLEQRLALSNVSFRVTAGEMVAVVGPNGAGKSTLFNLVVGTVRPSHGSIHVYGHDPNQHTCIAYVPQRNQYDWSFPVTAWDVVMMGRVASIGLFRHPGKRDREIVDQCLERVDAANLATKQIGDLSGGQQQRIFIARALAQEAELLMLDEPFSGLDGPSGEAIMEILDSLSLEGVTILTATHDINLAAQRFSRIMLLNGRIVALGSPEVVLDADNLLLAYGGKEV